MFNVTRSCPAPESLKASSKYSGEDVHSALQKIFFSKCYLCETKEPRDINIEHFRPKSGNKSLTLEWNNLYYACSRCNNIKSDGFDNILDCCNLNDDVFRKIKLLPPSSPNANNVFVSAEDNDERTIQTKILLDKIYNSDHTVNKRITSVALRQAIFDQYGLLYKHMIKYCAPDSTPAEKDLAIEKLKILTGRESAFSAFMRWTILEDNTFGPLLEPYMD